MRRTRDSPAGPSITSPRFPELNPWLSSRCAAFGARPALAGAWGVVTYAELAAQVATARAALAAAIATEDYEQAAKSRDEIAALEAALKPA